MPHERLCQGEAKPTESSLEGYRDSVRDILGKASDGRQVAIDPAALLDDRNRYVDRYVVHKVGSQEEASKIGGALEGRLVADVKYLQKQNILRVDVSLDRYREGRLSATAGSRFCAGLFLFAFFMALAAAIAYDQWLTSQELH